MLIDFIKIVYEWLKGRSPASIARFTAFLLVPGGILVSVMSGVYGDSLRWDLAQPLTVSQLKTEISAKGNATPKPGVALIFEPATSDEYHVQLRSASEHLWSSLDEQTAYANRERLKVDGREISGTTPFVGVSEPVTVVVEAEIGENIFLPGRKVKTDNWQLPSRRSESLVACVLLSCAFAFGMSLARGFPSADRTKQSAG